MPGIIDLNLRVGPVGAGAYEVVAETEEAGRAGPEPLGWEALSDPDFQAQLTALRGGASFDKSTARRLGETLFTTLVGGQVLRLFTGLYDQRIRGQGDAYLRLRLDVDERAPEIALLPWELLRWRDVPLATQAQTLITRHLPHLDYGAAGPLALDRAPRVLVVIPGGSGLAVDDERNAITETLDDASLSYALLDGNVTLERLADALAEENCHILHFIGHGAAARMNGELTGLLRFNLSARRGGEEWISHDRIQALLGPYRDLRLVVLNACHGAAVSGQAGRTDPESGCGFVGLAPAILRAGVPAVVAMQFAVRDETASRFGATFYRRLATGKWVGRVDMATALARNACYLAAPDDPGYAAPVLFLRTRDSLLFSAEQTTSTSAPAAATGTQPTIVAGKGSIVAGGSVLITGTVITGDVAGDVHVHQAPAVEIAPPPEPAHPPEREVFIGRDAEIAYYAEKLTTSHIAVITGMAGVGKTSLAAALARRTALPNKIFWHTFHTGESFQSIVWTLAGFLAHQDQPELWRLLQASRQTGGQPPPAETLFDYLLQMVRGRGYLLCLDDFQFVDEDPLLNQLVERLRRAVLAGELDLIITGRRMPVFVQTVQFTPLDGLSLIDTATLTAARCISLPVDFVAQLHARTGGNAELLTLAIEALCQAANPSALLDRLAETDDIERYLLTAVDRNLTEEERIVMGAVAVMLGYPTTRDAVEAVLDGPNVRRTLSSLGNRYLLSASQGRAGAEYVQHAMVQAFYYDLLGRAERRAMHKRAATYYQQEEPEPLRAMLHAERSSDYALMVQIAAENTWTLINRGHAQVLHKSLGRLNAGQLDALSWAKALLARGQVQALLGDGAASCVSLETALTTLAQQPDTRERRELSVRACLSLGDLLTGEAPQEALAWLQEGLAILGLDTSRTLEGALYVKLGGVESALGHYEPAEDALTRALAILPPEATQLRASALMNLGTVCSLAGDLTRSIEYGLQALDVAEQLNDRFLALKVESNLGIDREITGDWVDAASRYRRSLELAEQLGSVYEQSRIANSLGCLLTKQGDYAGAQGTLERALNLAREHNLNETALYILSSQIELQVRRGCWAALSSTLDQAELLASKIANRYLEPYIQIGRMQASLALGDTEKALAAAEQALALARELELTLEAGISLRAVGQARLAAGDRADALTTLEEAVAQLANLDPYETARTQMVWAQALLQEGDDGRAAQLLEVACATFQQLGAAADLADSEKLRSQIRVLPTG
jgi:tetratricopeptide (TPR) repeat protein